jgi:hypothetical protein
VGKKCKNKFAIAGGTIVKGDFPLELLQFKLSVKRVCGSPWKALKFDWGFYAKQSLFIKKDIIWKENFHVVWWDRLGATTAQYPKMHRACHTKLMMDFYRNSIQLYYWSKGTHSPKYKFCGTEDEYTMHMWMHGSGTRQHVPHLGKRASSFLVD